MRRWLFLTLVKHWVPDDWHLCVHASHIVKKHRQIFLMFYFLVNSEHNCSSGVFVDKLENLQVCEFGCVLNHKSLVVGVIVWYSDHTFPHILPRLLLCQHFDVLKHHSDYLFRKKQLVLSRRIAILLSLDFPLNQSTIIGDHFIENIVVLLEGLHPWLIELTTECPCHFAEGGLGVLATFKVRVSSEKSIFLPQRNQCFGLSLRCRVLNNGKGRTRFDECGLHIRRTEIKANQVCAHSLYDREREDPTEPSQCSVCHFNNYLFIMTVTNI